MAAGAIIKYEGSGSPGLAFVFLLFTAYLFVGIAIASDIFMNAIEKICSATRTVKETKEEDGVIVSTTKEVLIWNGTVANLTLMALGSSAPEIMLSCIEISLGLGAQDSGDLGPGTIVGSAAFNLFVISGLCICCLKGNETRRIKLYNVFIVTCVSSLFAYLWMVVVLSWSTPDQVDLAEAIATLMFCPILVGIAYWADQDFCMPGLRPRKQPSAVASETSHNTGRELYFGDDESVHLYDDKGDVKKDVLERIYNQLMELATLTPEEVTTILATKLFQAKPHARSWYRTKTAKILLGGSNTKGVPALSDRLQEVADALESQRKSTGNALSLLKPEVTSADTYTRMAVVEFQAAALAVPEAIGSLQVTINRSGKEDVSFSVHVESIDGSAKAGTQYQKVSRNIQFDPYVKEQTVEVPIIDNSEWNPDSNFYLQLRVLPEHQDKAVLGQMRIIDIIIEDDEKPGKISFLKRGYRFRDGLKVRYLEVERSDGYDGPISASWKVIPRPTCTIVPANTHGKVEFAPGEKLKMIEIPLLSHTGDVKGDEQTFEVELFEPKNGSKLGNFPVTTCAITSDEGFKLEVTHVMIAAITQCEEAEEDVSWGDQIKQSILPNDGNYKEATWIQWVMHILVFPFKFTFALIPPPHIGKGWPCFVLALFVIGVLTKFVGDSASAFGDACGLQPVITAITVVALGTSLPDTFASVIAARSDQTADNAIGNVTGSNSVNVFLGLGLPWTIAAIYYAVVKQTNSKGDVTRIEPFCVQPGTLSFNVIEFSAFAFIALCILAFRRYSPLCGKAELGGPAVWKWITAVAMIMLWFLYVGLAILPEHNKEFANKFKDSHITACDLIEADRNPKKAMD